MMYKIMEQIEKGRKKMKLDILIVIDCSNSMRRVTQKLNEMVKEIIRGINSLPRMQGYEKHVTILRFPCYEGENPFILKDHISREIPDDFEPQIVCYGATDPEPALQEALRLADASLERWRDEGEDYAFPILLYLTDGYPYIGLEEDGTLDQQAQDELMKRYYSVAEKIKAKEANGKLVFVGCGIASGTRKADIGMIQQLTNYPNRICDLTDMDTEQALSLFINVVLPVTLSTEGTTEKAIRLFVPTFSWKDHIPRIYS